MIDVEITIPTEEFEYGEVLQARSNVHLELERLVPLDDCYAVLIWVVGDERSAVESNIRDHPAVQRVQEEMAGEARTLLDVRLPPRSGPLIEAILDVQATVFDAVGTAEAWEFRLGFLAHDDLTTFHTHLTEQGIPITVQHVRASDVKPEAWESDDDSPLSSEQHEAVLLAKARGYFDVPRRTSISELSEELEISDSAFSQRLRRGLSSILDDALSDDVSLRASSSS